VADHPIVPWLVMHTSMSLVEACQAIDRCLKLECIDLRDTDVFVWWPDDRRLNYVDHTDVGWAEDEGGVVVPWHLDGSEVSALA
jgi:hypothetical protein